jgi:hypothetical protein
MAMDDTLRLAQAVLIEGWTSLRVRDEAIAAQPREAKRKKKAKR